ncbi:hypothetical protein B7463_g10427, partial [Scytalidium lignicola]
MPRGGTLRGQESWTRSTAACNGCRRRKQTVVEPFGVNLSNKSNNTNCGSAAEKSNYTILCSRVTIGPAKGYVEALKSRLFETENVLLQILSAISSDHLFSILAFELKISRTSKAPENQWFRARQSGKGENGSRASETVDTFPISTGNNVVMSLASERSSSKERLVETMQEYRLPSNNETESESQDYVEEDPTISQNNYPTSYESPRVGNGQLNQLDMMNSESSTATSTRESRFGFSKEFQEAFLW